MPEEIPYTVPLDNTEAIDGAEEDQVPPETVVETIVEVPVHKTEKPLIVPAIGVPDTVMTVVATDVPQPAGTV